MIRFDKKNTEDEFCYMVVWDKSGETLRFESVGMPFHVLLPVGSVRLDTGQRQADLDAPLLIPIKEDKDLNITSLTDEVVLYAMFNITKPSEIIKLDLMEQHGKIKELI